MSRHVRMLLHHCRNIATLLAGYSTVIACACCRVACYRTTASILQAELMAVGNSGRMVFHTFSNTGWVSLGGFLEIYGSLLLPHVCGAVIDSAPQSAVSGLTTALATYRSVQVLNFCALKVAI